MRVLLSWSSGKDSAWALHLLRAQADVEVVGLLTTFNGVAERVAMHAVRRTLVEAQAERVGLPLWSYDLPSPCSNSEYEAVLGRVFARAREAGVEAIAYGDLFLRDIREYRERQMEGTGLQPIFPVWDLPTGELARTIIHAGVRARVTCVDPARLDRSYAGREFDLEMVEGLPDGIDPCGENGEFHTFVYASPVFSQPIAVEIGATVERDGFVFADVMELQSRSAGRGSRSLRDP